MVIDAEARTRLRAAIAAAAADGRDVQARSLRAVETAAAAPERYLLDFTIDDAGRIRAAVASGDPARADHFAVFVPGLGAAADDLPRFAAAVDEVRRLADAQAAADGGDDVTVAVAWLGYTPPTVAGSLQPNRSAASYRPAVDGAPALRNFIHRWAGDADTTLVAHSYGSVVAGAAVAADAADGRRLCDRLLAVGSPGLGLTGAAPVDLFVLEAAGDAVAGLGWFGADPDTLPGVRQLSTRRSRHGRGGAGHTHYLDAGTTSQWNVAAVAGGHLDKAVGVDRRPLLTRARRWAGIPVKLGVAAAAHRYHGRVAAAAGR